METQQFIFSSKEIIGINFNERIEDIGTEAFKKCDDLESNTFVLPSSLQHTGNKAFEDVNHLKQLDLTNFDYVIKIDTDPFSKDGCLYNNKINTILVKDQAMKGQYSNDKLLIIYKKLHQNTTKRQYCYLIN